VIKELPDDLSKVVLGEEFEKDSRARFKDLDLDEDKSLTREELIPVIADLSTSGLKSCGVSANVMDDQAGRCLEAFDLNSDRGLDEEEFVELARFLVVDAYLEQEKWLSEEGCPVPDEPQQTSPKTAKKKERPYDLNWLKVYGAAMGASVGLFFAKGAPVAIFCQAVFMLCAVLGGFVVGQNLPAPWPQRGNPSITCVAVSFAACSAWSALSGAGFMRVLQVFKSTQGAGGMLLMPLLQPLLISLGLSLSERRRILAEDYKVILSTCMGSSFFGLFFMAVLAGPILHLPTLVVGSAVPSLVTTPLAVAIADMLGPLANIDFAIALVLAFGLIGAAVGLNIMRAWKFRSPLLRGVSQGATATGLGTVAITRTDPEAFTYSAGSFALCGAFATVLVAIPPLRALLVKIILFAK